MSLRKSPIRTPALLAANRANAQKSTGPRTPEGKRRISLNGLRHGDRAKKLFAFLAEADRAWLARLSPSAPPVGPAVFGGAPPYNFEAHPYTTFFNQAGRDRQELLGIYRALYAAFLPDPASEVHVRYVRQVAIRTWLLSRKTDRWARSRAWRQAHLTPGGALPRPQHQRYPRGPNERTQDGRRGWWVTVSVWLRRGRGRATDHPVRPGYGWQEGRGRLHCRVTVTASMRHPALGYRNVEDVPPGEARRMVLPLKPESLRKHVKFPVVIPDSISAIEARMEAHRVAEQAWRQHLVAVAARGRTVHAQPGWLYWAASHGVLGDEAVEQLRLLAACCLARCQLIRLEGGQA